MAKYIADVSGVLTEVKPLNVASSTPANGAAWSVAGDVNKIIETNSLGKIDVSLLPFRVLVESSDDNNRSQDSGSAIILDATGRISEDFMPVGVGAEITKRTNGGVALTAGMFVTLNAAIAPASNTAVNTKCDGFVLLAYAASAPNAVVYGISNTNTAVTGLTPNVPYWLGTNGTIVTSASLPTANNSIIQPIGKPSAATSIILANTEFFYVKAA